MFAITSFSVVFSVALLFFSLEKKIPATQTQAKEMNTLTVSETVSLPLLPFHTQEGEIEFLQAVEYLIFDMGLVW